MLGGWEIGRLAGISVRIHWSFLVLPALVAWSTWSASGAEAALGAVVFVLAIFGCVVLHELGHALAARRFGIGTEDITLLPIGGVARLERMPRQPVQELLIALAGPAVNVVIAGAIMTGIWLSLSSVAPLLDSDVLSGSFLGRLFWANVGLVIFNLLPAFPMDGGRVFRSLLAMRLPYARATELAGGLATVMAVLFGLFGLLGNPMLILVAAFVYFAARSEVTMARVQQQTSGVNTGDLMQRHFQTVQARARVADLAPWLPRTSQRDFPVIDGRRMVGMIRDTDVLAAMASGQGERLVGEMMRRDVPTAMRDDEVLESFATMQNKGLGSLPVADAGMLVGLLSQEQVRRWLEFLHSHSTPSTTRPQFQERNERWIWN
ncbi:MAG: site-2 protease family protein [Pirellulaceae bacterium]|nr:site-2 protease family protein [Pirellulaceae bacterium]